MGCLLYMDDIVLLAEDKETMVKLLEVAGEYRRDFRVKFGVDKSQVNVVEGQEGEGRDRWMLGDSGDEENAGV